MCRCWSSAWAAPPMPGNLHTRSASRWTSCTQTLRGPLTRHWGSHPDSHPGSRYEQGGALSLQVSPSGSFFQCKLVCWETLPSDLLPPLRLQISPYAKLLPMLAGIGSPGTLQEVRAAGRRGGKGCLMRRGGEKGGLQRRSQPGAAHNHLHTSNEQNCVCFSQVCVWFSCFFLSGRRSLQSARVLSLLNSELCIPAQRVSSPPLERGLCVYASPPISPQVIRGYVGDSASKPIYDSPTPFDVLGTGFQRPMELATLRLFNMIGILPKCE